MEVVVAILLAVVVLGVALDMIIVGLTRRR
jgi:hypothetical protein